MFDGHSGWEAAEHLASNLLDHLLGSSQLAQRDYGQALRHALLACEEELLAENHHAGSTALLALMVGLRCTAASWPGLMQFCSHALLACQVELTNENHRNGSMT